MSFSNVKAFFESRGLGDRVTELPQSSATVELAAQAIGCGVAQIAKTMSFLVSDAPVVIVCAGDVKIDNPKYKAQFHEKAKMIPAPMLEEYVGHAMGGVCPFALKDGVKIYLDESLKVNETLYPAAGSGNGVARLTLPELEDCVGSFEWVDVCKPIG